MQQLLNVEYNAEHEAASVDGEAALAKFNAELERPPPGRRRGRSVSHVTQQLDDLMRMA